MNDIFEEFSNEFFKTYLEINPQAGTHLGLHEYDGKVADVSENGIKKEIQIYKELYRKLRKINHEELSSINRYDYDVAKWAIESELFDLEEIKSYKKNPMIYVLMFSGFDKYLSMDYAPFEDRLRSIINIIDKIPEVLNEAEINLEKSLPGLLCKYAKNFSTGYISFFQNELLTVIKEKTDNKKLIEKYIQKSGEAVKALERYIGFIDKAGSDTNENFRLGKDKFLKMLKVKEQIDLSIEDIKKLGSDELKRLQDELAKVIKENNFEGKLETLEHSHPAEGSLISDTNNMLNELVDFIRDKDLINLPEELNCIVTEMPKYSDFGFAAMGTAGPFEKSNESFYYVNLPDKNWDEMKKKEWLSQFNYPALKLISIHEAYPGHYTHFLNANKYSTKLSKLFMSYSYIEGWAHYAEEMMIEQGYSKDDFKSKIGMLIEALIRCCRYFAAIGIHCGNMTVEEAKQFFFKNAYMNETTAMQEAERGAFDPGYLNYTLGKILIKTFREKYFAKFNETKSLKDFHNRIVSLGAPTYKIAESFVL
ncbi:MAG: DUF885 domain-containing protein [Bacteroidota bacterium]|nr:DUF885 domain-containing protein [Bacteroidota bacterium]